MSVRFAALSFALLAAAGAVAESQPATVRRVTIRSRVLNEERSFRVALPADYATAKQRYPVVYVLDGHVRAFFDMAVAATAYDVLGDVHDFAIPAQIVVGVEHPDRGSDLGRNADAFMKYLVEELVPYIEKNFRALPYRILVGHSLGGRFALMASCRAPGVFPSVVAVSPGGGDPSSVGAITQCLQSDWKANGGKLRQIVINSGQREARIDESAKRLRAFLRDSAPASVRWQYMEGPGLAHTETPFFGIPGGIKFSWDRSVWEMPAARADSLLEAKGDPDALLARWDADLAARVGVAMPTSPKWLDVAALAHVKRGDRDAAERTARRLVSEYPEYPNGYARLADLLIARNDLAAGRKVLEDALRTFDKLDFFDLTERALKRKVLADALARIREP